MVACVTVPPLRPDGTVLRGGPASSSIHSSVAGGLALCCGRMWDGSFTLNRLKESEKRSQACDHSRGACRTAPRPEAGVEDPGHEVTHLARGSLPDTGLGTDRDMSSYVRKLYFLLQTHRLHSSFFLDGEAEPPVSSSRTQPDAGGQASLSVSTGSELRPVMTLRFSPCCAP